MNSINRKLNCLMVEPDSDSHQVLSEFLSRSEGIELIKACVSAHEALTLLGAVAVDVVLVNGDHCSEADLDHLRIVAPGALLILLSECPMFDIGHLDDSTFDCLIKPITYSRLGLALERVKQHLHYKQLCAQNPPAKESEPMVMIKTNGKVQQVLTEDILYIESDGEYLNYHTRKGRFVSLGSLKKTAKNLSDDFVQVHRSYAVNRAHILGKSPLQLELVGNRVIPIGKTYRNSFEFTSNAVLV